ncbi:MAG TPA: biotin--[acetyl-CoA-carboxylase] ligase [Acidobacteriota bacterium]|nr:biotin--[acetyl-CoA-carboxylase] ligase [Acidobacteriota bacterium]
MRESMTPHDQLLIDIVARLRVRPSDRRELAAAVNLSPEQLDEAAAELRGFGYALDVAHDRIALTETPDRMIDTEILAGLQTAIFARQLHCYGTIRSTNVRARELAEAGAPDGTVVVAEQQTGGIGRFGRPWHSAAGLGIWSTVILRPPGPPEKVSGLSLLAGVVFAQTVEEELGLTVGLKWPNDGLIDGKKVIGILTELATESGNVEYAVCGTGINVAHTATDFPPELREIAASLAMAKGEPVGRMAFYRAFLRRFDTHYRHFRNEGIGPFLSDYRDRSILLGRDVTIQQGKKTITGRAVAIDDSGALVIRSGSDDILVFSGEATLHPR